MTSIDEQLNELEKAYRPYSGAVAGTSISRVLMDAKLLKQHGIYQETDRESLLVWCVALGSMTDRKQFFYAVTITGALRKARQAAKQS